MEGSNKEIIIRKRQKYLQILKLILLLVGSYLLIQLSNEAKHMEEKAGIPGLETTYDFAEKYVYKRYDGDWNRLGHRLYNRDSYMKIYNLILESGNDEIEVSLVGSYENDKTNDRQFEISGFTFFAKEDYLILHKNIKKEERLFSIRIAYNGDPHIEIAYYISENSEDFNIYTIEYDDGAYLPNAEMEQQTGITTEEVADWAEDMRRIFEEEMQKMHNYQIEKAAGKRRGITNTAYAILIIAVVWKLCLAAGRSRKEQMPFGECFRETIGQTINAFWKRRYLLLGMWTAFWIYILQPLLSLFDYWGLSGTMKEYTAYGTGAVLVAAGNLLFVAGLKEYMCKDGEQSLKVSKVKAVLQVIAGCVTMILLVRLGIMFVSDYYPGRWEFYIKNLMSEVIALGLFCMIKGLSTLNHK